MKLIFTLLAVSITFFCSGQGVGIGTTTPNSSAMLDVNSANKGFLPPRMTAASRKAILSPAAGLIVFDTDAGQLYLYNGNKWSALSTVSSSGGTTTPEQQTPPDSVFSGNQALGGAVAISGNYAVAGADLDNSFAGAVFVYKKTTGGNWIYLTKLVASDASSYSYFGASVAMAGNYIVVGAPGSTVGTVNSAGKVYVFQRTGSDTWTEQASFSKPGGAGGSEYFGRSVAISVSSLFGPVIVAGAPYVDGGVTDRGAAYTFRFNGTSWVYGQALLPTDLATSDYFGYTVTVDGDYCAVAAPFQDNGANTNAGSVYIYVYGGGVWTQQKKLQNNTTDAAYGRSLCLKNDTIIIGAPLAQYYSAVTPAVYVYARSGADWNYLTAIFLNLTAGYAADCRFGLSVSLEHNVLLIAVPYGIYQSASASFGQKHGSVLVYKKNAGYFKLSAILNDDEPLATGTSNIFGNSVSIHNGNYIIGIPYKNSFGGSIAFGYIE